ncbi:MAG: AraC family transcriptional regulator [Bacillota bacterium]|nr:AraC family transcriptional regulator [Bacillota bacterium]
MSNMIEEIKYPDGVPVKAQLLEIKEYPLHKHPDFQIVYVLEGELDLRLTFTHYTLRRNSVHIIHNDDVHSFTSISESNLLLVININVEYFSNYFPGLGAMVFTTKVSETASSYKNQTLLREQIFSIVSEQYNKAAGYESRIIDNTLSLLTNLINHFRGFSIEKNNRIFEHKTAHDLFQLDRISRIISYIYMNYSYKLSLAEIAESEKISTYYLSHLFQKFMGESFRNFVSLVRVEMSEPTLLATDESISKIAQDVGFSDVKYYVENFKNWFGHHPKEYRRLFADEIIGRKDPKSKELPLDRLKESIEEYTNYPVFKGSEKPVSIIDVDFNGPAVALMSKLSSAVGAVSEIDLIREGIKIPDEYYDVNQQRDCVELAGKLAEKQRLENLSLPLMDGGKNQKGLFAVNGLKKPMSHFLGFLREMPAGIVSSGVNYLAVSGEGSSAILAFNPKERESILLTFNVRELSQRTKLTKKHMHSQSTFAYYWSQLDFKEELTAEEYDIIQRMSMPEISFRMIPAQKQYKLSCTLEPLDIVLFLFSS